MRRRVIAAYFLTGLAYILVDDRVATTYNKLCVPQNANPEPLLSWTLSGVCFAGWGLLAIPAIFTRFDKLFFYMIIPYIALAVSAFQFLVITKPDECFGGQGNSDYGVGIVLVQYAVFSFAILITVILALTDLIYMMRGRKI